MPKKWAKKFEQNVANNFLKFEKMGGTPFPLNKSNKFCKKRKIKIQIIPKFENNYNYNKRNKNIFNKF